MTFDVISTGSQGNAVVLNKNILIDCGVPFSKIKPYMKELWLVLLTHVHGDHFNPRTVRALHRERPGLRWGCCEWMVGPLLEAGVDKRVIDVYQQGDTLCYSGGGHLASVCLRPDHRGRTRHPQGGRGLRESGGRGCAGV